MASRIGINAYTIRFKRRGRIASSRSGNGNGNGKAPEWLTFGVDFDPFKEVGSVLQQNQGPLFNLSSLDPKDTRVIRIKDVHANQTQKRLSGTIEAGDYGTACLIVDAVKDKVSYRKTKSDAETPPFYYTLWFPVRCQKGLLLCQRNGLRGVKTQLELCLRKWLPDLVIECRPLTDSKAIEEYLTGSCQELRLVAYKQDAESRAVLRQSKIGGRQLDHGTRVEVVFKNPRGIGDLTKPLRAVFGRKQKAGDLVEVYGLDNPDEVYIDLDNGSRRRKFNLSRLDANGISWDVTSDVTRDSDGHATYDSMHTVAAELLDEIKQVLV